MLPYKNYYYFLLVVVFISHWGCRKPTEPEKLSPPKVVLTAEDASCTEIWLRLEFSSEEPVTSVTLSRNDSVIYRNTIFPADTVIFDSGLNPSREYEYKATVTVQQGKLYNFFSGGAATMDTSSGEYVWQTFIFGEHSHSIIRDIAIIDENNIWAVGAIFLKDSLGNDDFTNYNALHWNGTEWQTLRIPFEYNGGVSYSELYTVRQLNETDFWFGVASIVELINGQYRPMLVPAEIFPSRMNDMYVGENKKAYLLGNNGNLAHYNGANWTKIESQTNLDLTSITYYEGKYYMIGNKEETGYSCILELKDNVTNKLFEGSWFTPHNGEYVGELLKINQYSKHGIYIRSDGWIYRLEVLRDSFYLNQINSRFTRYTYDMSGTGHNNIWVAGENGAVGHFNGINYQEISSLRNNAIFYRCVNVNENVVAIGGKDFYSPLSSKARITIGKKIR